MNVMGQSIQLVFSLHGQITQLNVAAVPYYLCIVSLAPKDYRLWHCVEFV